MQNIGDMNFDDGIRTITVNDKGDYIAFSINDNSLAVNFAGLIRWFEQSEKKVQEFTAGFDKRHKYIMRKDKAGNYDINYDAIEEISKFRSNMSKEVCAKIDAIFGEGSCRKVFGNIIPDIRAVGEFLRQLTPFIEKAGKERMDKHKNQYDAGRKGSRSKNNRQRKEFARGYGQKQLQYSNGPTAAGMEGDTN